MISRHSAVIIIATITVAIAIPNENEDLPHCDRYAVGGREEKMEGGEGVT